MGKSKKAAKADRQKVIDDIRRKQKRADNRQGAIIIVVCIGIAILIVGAAAWNPVSAWVRRATISADSLSEIGSAPDVCGKVALTPQAGNQHIDQSTTAPYAVAPPATGNHWNVQNIAPVPRARRFYSRDDRPELEQLVHNSEHGYALLWYDDSVGAGEIAEIQKMAEFLDDNDTNGRFKFKAIPWTEDDVERIEKQQQANVDAAQAGVDSARAAAEQAKGKKAKGEAKTQLKTAQTALKDAKAAAEKGGEFPDGMHIAFTHWTADGQAVHQYCSEPSGAALEEFMFDYPYTDTPEPNAM